MSGMGCNRCYDSPCTCAFIEHAVAGRFVDLEEGLCDAVEAWHEANGNSQDLHEFLGLTDDEYKRIVEQPTQLAVVVEERRAKR